MANLSRVAISMNDREGADDALGKHPDLVLSINLVFHMKYLVLMISVLKI